MAANIAAIQAVFGSGSGMETATLGLSPGMMQELGLTGRTNVMATIVVSHTYTVEHSGDTYVSIGVHIDGQVFQLERRDFSFANTAYVYTGANGANTITVANFTSAKAADMNEGVIADILLVGANLGSNGFFQNGEGFTVAGANDKLMFQIGANGTADQQVGTHVMNMSTAHLGTKDGLVSMIDVTTRESANLAIKIIDGATNMVSSQRAELGALQNRLEHTLNNLGITKENLTAAESTIRDVDMAKEMMEFTKNSILVQASQAMLAQANSLPQGVLSLLR